MDYKDTDEPSNIPVFQGGIKTNKKASTIDANGVVEAFSYASPPAASSASGTTPGVYPAKAANLRMKTCMDWFA